jgi:hypothetical protein
MPLLEDAPRFLTYEELRAEIARYVYKDNWTMSVFMDPWEGVCAYFVADVPDAYHPGETVELRIRSNIPPIPSAEYFAIWLTWRVSLIELHEAREYLRYRLTGLPVYDPHQVVEPGGRAARKEMT